MKKKNCAVGFAFTTTICGGTPATGNRRPVGVRFRGALSRGIRFRSGLVHMMYGGAEGRKMDFRGSSGVNSGVWDLKGFRLFCDSVLGP